MIEDQLEKMADILAGEHRMILTRICSDAVEHIKDLKAALDHAEDQSVTCPECGKYIS